MFQSSARPKGGIQAVWQDHQWLLHDEKGVLCFDGTSVGVPNRAWADAIAAEWPKDQKIDPLAVKKDRPASQLAKLSLLGTQAEPEKFIANLMHYLTTDTVFYWQQNPAGLYAQQEQYWQPILDWAGARFGTVPEKRYDLQPLVVSADFQQRVRQALVACDAHSLAILVFLCGINGSILLSLAQTEKAIDAESAYQAACLEALYQRSRWGADAEGDARLERAGKSFTLVETLLLSS